MKALLEKADLFAHQINFNYKKKTLYHSFFGLGLSFLFYIVMILFVNHFSSDFIKQQNPRVLYTETEFNENSTITLLDIMNLGEFDFSLNSKIKIEKFENKTFIPNYEVGYFFIDQIELFGPNISSKTYILNSPIKIENIKEQNSTNRIYRFSGNFHQNTEVVHLKNNSYITYKNLNQTNLTIRKYTRIIFGFEFGGSFLQYFNIKDISLYSIYMRCNILSNTVDTNSGTFFNLYYKAIIPSFKFSSGKIQFNKYKSNYGFVRVKDDKGFIISRPDDQKKLKENHDSTEISELEYRTSLLEIDINPILKQYDRIYKKLQNVFSDLGGIMSSLMLIGKIIVVQFNKLKFDYDLINRLYLVERESDDPDIRKFNSKISGNEKILSRMKNRRSINEIDTSRIPLNNSLKNHHAVKFKNLYSNQIENKKLESPINYSRIDASSIKNDEKKYFLNDMEMINNKNFSCILNPLPLVNIKSEKKEKQASQNVELICEYFNKKKLFKKPLIYSKADFFKTFLCCEKLKGEGLIEKEKLFSSAQDQIYDYMDVTNYVRLFEKLDKLISIVFNENQALSFNYLRNKKISELKKDKIVEKESIIKVINYFKKQTTNSKMSQIDERLLDSFFVCFSNLI